MRYPAIAPSRSKGYVPNFANDRLNKGVPKRNSFPANTNGPPVSKPGPTPAKQAANYRRAAQHLAGKIAAKQVAKAALNFHPAGRALRLAWDLYEFADELGLFTPAKPAVQPGFPGFQQYGKCSKYGTTHAVSSNGTFSQTLANLANSCTGGQGAAGTPLADFVAGSQAMNIQGRYRYQTIYGPRDVITGYWHRPAGTYDPVKWVEGAPAVAPQFVPMTRPSPRSTPVYRPNPRARPQRRPGISIGTTVRPNNLGTIELSVTGPRVRLRLNGDNRPPHAARETKSRARTWGAMYAIYRIADASTEAVDFLEVLAKATGYEGEDGAENAMKMAEHVAFNLHRFDPVVFVVEYLLNELEDQVISRISGRMDRVFRKAGIRNPEFGWAM